MSKPYRSFEQINQVHQQLTDMRYEYWLHHDLFSFQWWLLLTILVVPWFIWWKFVDRKRMSDILLFGALLMVLVTKLDDLGVELHLWSYPYQLVQFMPRLIPVDIGILAVAHMFLYQYFPNWKKFIFANFIMALIFSFICEPITVWLGIYKLENWKYIYSFPIYIMKAALIKWLVDEIFLKKQKAAQTIN